MGLFDQHDISKVQPNGDHRYLKPGNFRLRVQKIEGKILRNAGPSLCIQTEVLKSSDEDRHGVGTTADIVISFQKQPESARRDAKGLVLALAGLPADSQEIDDIASALLKACERVDNPFRGLEFEVYAYNHVTKAGGDFTRYVFSPGGSSAVALMRQIVSGGAPLTMSAPPPPPPPPPPAAKPNRQAGWKKDPTGAWALNPQTNQYERAE